MAYSYYAPHSQQTLAEVPEILHELETASVPFVRPDVSLFSGSKRHYTADVRLDRIPAACCIPGVLLGLQSLKDARLTA